MFPTHVFLGPSLPLDIAISLLPEAHYHPPIQCGDIIRLLRLNPKKIIIIDGLYETVPAIWHKEILIAMSFGIEIWGAASMGALRAAELNAYGMHGFGKIYEAFKTGKLNDDDEVAVLHKGKSENFAPINDAMVNIRATCELAHKNGLLTFDEMNSLLGTCKQHFYPYRSLLQIVLKKGELHRFSDWLKNHGLIDLKKQDAMDVLKHHHDRPLSPPKPTPVQEHLTVFLRELIQYASLKPFMVNDDWLPPIEKQLHLLYQQSPKQYMLVAELAFFTRKLFSLKPSTIDLTHHDKEVDFIKTHALYHPESDFKSYRHTPELNEIYTMICQTICQKKITQETMERYLPIISHYYDIKPATVHHQKLFRVLLLLILSMNTHSYKTQAQVSESVVIQHCQEVMRRRRYTVDKFREWFHPTAFKQASFINFLMHYLMSLRGSHYRSQTHLHYHWIYEAYLYYVAIEKAALSVPENLLTMES